LLQLQYNQHFVDPVAEKNFQKGLASGWTSGVTTGAPSQGPQIDFSSDGFIRWLAGVINFADERTRRYWILYETGKQNGTVTGDFDAYAANAELQEMRQEASNWNYTSPQWSWNNQCYDQAMALRKHLANHFDPHYWYLDVVGGSKWLGARNHNVLGLEPINGNPNPAMYFDPFKYFWPDLNMKCECLKNFKEKYPGPVGQANP
jgi:hypothetical protein